MKWEEKKIKQSRDFSRNFVLPENSFSVANQFEIILWSFFNTVIFPKSHIKWATENGTCTFRKITKREKSWTKYCSLLKQVSHKTPKSLSSPSVFSLSFLLNYLSFLYNCQHVCMSNSCENFAEFQGDC